MHLKLTLTAGVAAAAIGGAALGQPFISFPDADVDDAVGRGIQGAAINLNLGGGKDRTIRTRDDAAVVTIDVTPPRGTSRSRPRGADGAQRRD